MNKLKRKELINKFINKQTNRQFLIYVLSYRTVRTFQFHHTQ